MLEMQIRQAKAALLFIAFILYTAIAVLHPLTHHHLEATPDQDHHECSICSVLCNNTVDLSPVISFLVFFAFIYFVRLFSVIPKGYSYLAVTQSRAPPSSL
jgi:hypothetical protein